MDDNSAQPASPAATQGGPVHNGVPLDITPDPVAAPASKEQETGYWEHYAREIELEEKIAEIGGVEKVESGEVKVPQNLAKEMGIRPTVTIDTPIAKVVPDFTIRGIALTDDQLGNGLAKPTSSGFRWLVEWFIYQLLKAHFLVKKIKGKVLRSAPASDQQKQI